MTDATHETFDQLRNQAQRDFDAAKIELARKLKMIDELESQFVGKPTEPIPTVKKSATRKPTTVSRHKESDRIPILKAVEEILRSADRPLSTNEIAALVDTEKIRPLPKSKTLTRAVAAAAYYLRHDLHRVHTVGGKHSLKR